MTSHLDDFTLLRLTAGELIGEAGREASSHLATCAPCWDALAEIRQLDHKLRAITGSDRVEDDAEIAGFSARDPFRRRPRVRPHRAGAVFKVKEAVAASEAAAGLQESMLRAVKAGQTNQALTGLSLTEAENRFALLYALQESGRRIAEDPLRALEFAKSVVRRLPREASTARESPGERIVPWDLIRGQTHVLAAQAFIWTKQFARARSYLRVAYRCFGRVGDETSLAVVELNESQRRSFVREGNTALLLAQRAKATFEERGLEDQAARASVAEGLAYFDLDRQEEAIASYRRALPLLERYTLWSNYVGALNSIATSLNRLGRLDEARREYARVLRRFSREEHRSWQGFLRIGLAETLFSAGRFREAAISAARAAMAFADCGLRANALIVALFEVESWARHGSMGRAEHRLELFFDEATRARVLDKSVKRQLEEALSGANRDFTRLSHLREELDEVLRRRAGATNS